jgi:hypothetical protein
MEVVGKKVPLHVKKKKTKYDDVAAYVEWIGINMDVNVDNMVLLWFKSNKFESKSNPPYKDSSLSQPHRRYQFCIAFGVVTDVRDTVSSYTILSLSLIINKNSLFKFIKKMMYLTYFIHP